MVRLPIAIYEHQHEQEHEHEHEHEHEYEGTTGTGNEKYGMTLRDRFIATIRGEGADRLPFLDAGYNCLAAWHGQGLPETVDTEEQVERYFGLDRGVAQCLLTGREVMAVTPARALDALLNNYLGEAADEPSFFTPRAPVDRFPVMSERDLDAVIAARRADDPRRLPEALTERAEALASEDAAVGLYLWGFTACLDALLAPALRADDPELLLRVLDHHLAFSTALLDRVAGQATVDFLLIDETPAAVGVWPVYAPYYRDLLAHARGLEIEAVLAYSASDITGHLADLHAAGVDAWFPGCDVDVAALRTDFPTLAMLGGIDAGVLTAGREAIDQALRRVKPLSRAGGYIPGLNAPAPADAPLAAYQYYLERKWSLLIETDSRSLRY